MNPNMRLKIHRLQTPLFFVAGVFCIFAMAMAKSTVSDLQDDVEALGKENLALRQELQRATNSIRLASSPFGP